MDRAVTVVIGIERVVVVVTVLLGTSKIVVVVTTLEGVDPPPVGMGVMRVVNTLRST